MGKKGGEGPKGLGLKKGPWTKAEDAILVAYVREHGEGNWNAVQKNSGLSRCGKSCRLRWANHLRPNLKKGSFSPDEELLILRLHAQLGNKWARMAAQLPGRTDNEIKNYWNTRIKKRLKAGLPLYPPEIQTVEGAQPATTSSASSADAATAPFPLPEPIDFSPSITPLLTHHPFLSPAPHLKSFSLPYSAPVSPCSTASLFQYNLRNYELGSILYNPLLPETSPFSSAKTELPSTQLFSEPLGSGGESCGGQSGNSGLLDALLQESQSLRALLREKDPPPLPAEDEDAKIEPLEFGGSKDNGAPQDTNPVLEPGNKWEENSAGIKPKTEPMDEIIDPVHEDPVREDISTLLDMIPTVPMSVATLVPEWYNSDSGEISNGQSSGITSNDLGLDIPQLTSSLSVKPEDHDWTIGSCPWNNMPGIC